MVFKTLQHLRWIIVGLTAVVLFHVTIENTDAKKWGGNLSTSNREVGILDRSR